MVFFYLFFLSSLLVWCCLSPIFPSICKFPFLRMFWFLLNCVVLFLPLFVVFRFSLFTWHIFLWQIPSLYYHCISSLPILGSLVLFHFWKLFYIVHVHKVTNFFLRSMHPPMHFLSMWLRGIIEITNSNGDCASTRKIPLWIFTC